MKLGKDLAMIRDAEATQEAGSVPISGPGLSRKPYQSPTMVEWGSLVELTQGLAADIQDDGFIGSGGV
jgi:hypothetical protein